MVESLFWLSLFLLVHPYFIYPLTLILLGKILPGDPPVPAAAASTVQLPMVSVIVSAYNEEKVIGARVKNCLGQDYPADRLEILVGSDGSSDGTNGIMDALRSARIRFFAFGRQGKSATINRLVEEAKGDILIFTDANTEFNRDAVSKMVAGFANESVGAVCGRLVMVSADGQGAKGEGFYWKYETFLKKLESRLGIVQGGNGAIYGIRRELFRPLSKSAINDDFTISMNVYRAGKKMIYQESAIAREETAKDLGKELKRHVRDASGHYIAIMELGFLLNPLHGLVCYAYWSHRLLRWIFPFVMVIALTLNTLLLPSPVYIAMMALQSVFYGVAIGSGLLFFAARKTTPLFFTFYFLAINGCLILGLLKLVSGQAKPMWQSTER